MTSFRKPLAGLAAAIVLTTGGLVAVTSPAHAVALITAQNVDAGNSTAIKVSGCDDNSLYSGATVSIMNTSRGTVDTRAISNAAQTVSSGALESGRYEIRYTCLGYNGASDSTTMVVVYAWSTDLVFDPPTWAGGTPVTVSGEGLQPGETVSFAIYDVKNRQVWADLSAATVDTDGTFSYSLLLGTGDVPPGPLTLRATGDSSGLVRSGYFTWGYVAPTAPSAPVGTGSGNGLPSTGN